MAFLSDLQILKELQHVLQAVQLEGLEEVRLIKDKRTGMFICALCSDSGWC